MLQTFYFLVVAHFVADFILQGPVISAGKRGFNKHMLLHGVIMSLAFVIPLLGFNLGRVAVGAFFLFLLHTATDAARGEINRTFKLKSENYFYWVVLGIDQILHISAIYFLFVYFVVV